MGVQVTWLLVVSALQINLIFGFTLPLQCVSTKLAPIANKRQALNEDFFNSVENIEISNVPVKELAKAVPAEPCLYIASNLKPTANILIGNIPANFQGVINAILVNECPGFKLDLLPAAVLDEFNNPCYSNINPYENVELSRSVNPRIEDVLRFDQPHFPVQLFDPQLVDFEFQRVFPSPHDCSYAAPYNTIDIATLPQYLSSPNLPCFPQNSERPLDSTPSYNIESNFQRPPFEPQNFFTELIPVISYYKYELPFDFEITEQFPFFEQPYLPYFPNPYNPNVPFEQTLLNSNSRLTLEPDLINLGPCNDLSCNQFVIPIELLSQFERFNAPLKRDTSLCADLPLPNVCGSPPGLPLPMSLSNVVNNIEASNLIPFGSYNFVPPVETNPSSTWPVPSDCEPNFIPTPSCLSTPCVYPTQSPCIDPLQSAAAFLDAFQIPCSVPTLDFDCTSFTPPGIAIPEYITSLPPELFKSPECLNTCSSPIQNIDLISVLDNLQNSYTLPEVFVPQSVPVLPTFACNNVPSPALPSTTLPRPLSHFFEEARTVSAKLNDFIALFNRRVSSASTVRSPISLCEPILSPLPVSPSKFSPNSGVSSVYGCNLDSQLLSSCNNGLCAPKVPLSFTNDIYNPYATLIPYNNVQESISTLCYNNLLPIPYLRNVDPPSYNSFSTASSFPSEPYKLVPENLFACKTPTVPRSSFVTPCIDMSESRRLLADIMSSISVKGRGIPFSSYPEQPLPYLSPVSLSVPAFSVVDPPYFS